MIDSAEVQAGFVLPWRVLMDERHHHIEQRMIGGESLPVKDIRFGDYRIWGATAGILFALRELARE